MTILSNLFLGNKLNIEFSGVNFSSNYKNYNIGDLLEILKKKIDIKWESQKNLISEDKFLDINSSYIRKMINYNNVFNFNDTLIQTATFRPLGLLGRLYWYSVLIFHGIIFKGMLKKLTT